MKAKTKVCVWAVSVALLMTLGCGAEKKEGPDLEQPTKAVWNRLRVVERDVREAQNNATRDELIEYQKLVKKLGALRVSSAGNLASLAKMKVMTKPEIDKMNQSIDEIEKEFTDLRNK